MNEYPNRPLGGDIASLHSTVTFTKECTFNGRIFSPIVMEVVYYLFFFHLGYFLYNYVLFCCSKEFYKSTSSPE